MDVRLASDQDNFKSATESSEEEDTVDANERLLTAARNGQDEVVRDLISRSKLGEISLDVNCKGNQKFNRGWTSLHLAAYFGHKNVVKILLENGAGIDVTNPNGDTALHKAAYTGRLDVVRVLLDSGADVTLINSEGQTPRLFAKTREISELILAAEDHDNKKREQIFLSSVREGKLDLIQDMLQKQEKRPSLSCRDAYGNSALHIAAQANQKEIAVLLIQSGLAADLKNEKDKTPIDFARNNEMKQILGVRPIKEFSLHPHRCEGVLFKKSRFLGFRPVFVVLERGVLSYFRSRGDASTGTRRKGMRYLDGTIILLPKKSENNNCEFILKYSDGIQHTFSTGEGEQEIARQKWLNALKDHINYSSHYTHQGVTQSDEEEEILSLGSLQDTLKTAQAQQKLLEKEMVELTSAVTNPGGSTVVLQQIQKISQMAGEMNITFSQCLTLFQQQEEVRALQLKEEMEKSRVLQEALHALATEHHELEQSIAVRKPSTQRYYDTDEDEFYDCDEENLENSEGILVHGSFKEDVECMTYQSIKSDNPDKSKYGRTKLPVPMFDRNDFSVWTILKQCIGKELSKITMPVVFNEPISFLQRITEYMEYSELLEKASTCEDPVDRLKFISAFAVSAISSNFERLGKPFNPLLGETFEFDRPDLGFRMVSEQVSHHPPISAFYVESPNYKFHGSIHPKLKFWGKSVEVNPKGILTLELKSHNETYTWSNINCCVHNVIVGKLWVEHYGVQEIQNHNTKHKAVLNYKQGGWFGKDLNKVDGYIYSPDKKKLKALYGSWVKELYAVNPAEYDEFMKELNSGTSPSQSAKHLNGASTSTQTSDHNISGKSPSTYDLEIPGQEVIWKGISRPEYSQEYFSFTLFTMALNEITEENANKIPPTDCRLRPDIRLLEQGQIDLASAEKNRIEEKQRAARKERKKKKEEWSPLWFSYGVSPCTGKEDWLYKEEYWKRDWAKCQDIF